MKFILNLKHWQLFLLTFGIPFGLYIVFFITMFATMFSQVGNAEPVFPNVMIIGGAVIALAWLIAIACTLSWHFNVATGLFKKRPTGSTLKIKRFYFAFFYPITYGIVLVLGFGLFILLNLDSLQQNAQHSDQPPAFFLWFLLIIPLHLLTAACMFYIFYFIGKALKSVELQREPQMSEYVADFVLTWMFMIGVWFIQPRINQIFSDETPTTPSTSTPATSASPS